ncbi:metalloprotease family protein [Halomicrococcus gelatinilyticus]|uniref:metalloprotease family protein n=1 Tax=Halomicrococcus gelatinilyticus TaxID=1702103 RepID=UPI002E12546F
MYVDPDPECDEAGWGTARSTAVAVTAAVAFGGTYVATYGLDRYLTYTDALGRYGVVLQFGVMIGLVVLHEAVHAVAYAILGGLSWDEIAVEVGLDFDDGLDPLHHSVHPARPLRRRAYYAGVAAPGVVLGLLPAALALATGSALAAFVGVVGLLLVSTDVPPLVEAWRHPEAMAVADPAQ